MNAFFRSLLAVSVVLAVPVYADPSDATLGSDGGAIGGGGGSGPIGGGGGGSPSDGLPASVFPDDAPTLWAMIRFPEEKRADRAAIEQHFRIIQRQAKTDADKEKLAQIKRILTKETRKLYNWFLDKIRQSPDKFQGNAGIHLAMFNEYTGAYLAAKVGDQEEELSLREHKEHLLNFLLDNAERYPFPTATMVGEISRGTGVAEVHVEEVRAGIDRIEASEKKTAEKLGGGGYKMVMGICAVILAVGVGGWQTYRLIQRGDARIKQVDDQGLIGNGSVPEPAPVTKTPEDPLFQQGKKDLPTKPPTFDDEP